MVIVLFMDFFDGVQLMFLERGLGFLKCLDILTLDLNVFEIVFLLLGKNLVMARAVFQSLTFFKKIYEYPKSNHFVLKYISVSILL